MMPDVFDGNPIPLNRPGDFDIQKWLKGEMHPKGRSNLPPNVVSLLSIRVGLTCLAHNGCPFPQLIQVHVLTEPQDPIVDACIIEMKKLGCKVRHIS